MFFSFCQLYFRKRDSFEDRASECQSFSFLLGIYFTWILRKIFKLGKLENEGKRGIGAGQI